MAKVDVVRCDRCGRFCKDEETFVEVRLHIVGDPGPLEADLCDACEEGLRRYLDGAKLARVRRDPGAMP